MIRLRTFSRSLRRRSALTAAVALLIIGAVALTIVWQAAGLPGGRQAAVVRIRESPANQLILSGTGINLTGLPLTNLVTGGSFSPSTRHAHYFAHDGGADRLRIKMSEARSPVPLAKDYYTGASFSLFRESLSEMTLINTGRITGYEAGLVSGKREVMLPFDSEGIRWRGLVEREGVFYACGSGGNLVRLRPDGAPERMAFGFRADLTALAAGPGGMMAGDSEGKLYASPDGVNWNLISQAAPGYAVEAIEYIGLPDDENGFFLAAGGPGELFFGHPSGMERLTFPLDDRVMALVQSGDGMVYALGDRGQVASSANGIHWQPEDNLRAGQPWLAGRAGGGVTLFAGRNGQMAVKADKGPVRWLETAGGPAAKVEPAEVMIMSSEQYVVLAIDGRSLHSSDGGVTWSLENPFGEGRLENMALFSSGDLLLARRDGSMALAELTAQIRFEPALQDGRVVAGDLMTIRLSQAYELDTRQAGHLIRTEGLEAGDWAISAGSSLAILPDVHDGMEGYDSGGSCALSYEDADPPADHLPAGDLLYSLRRGTATQAPVSNPHRSYLSARLTQKLDLTRLQEADALPFYRLEFDARQSGSIDGPVEVWLSGTLPGAGESVRLQDDSWQHRRLTFIFPRNLKADDELWINFGFAGTGTLHLDNVWFGQNDDAPGALPNLPHQVAATGPDLVRLEAVPIGRSGYCEEAWCLPEGTGHAGGDDARAHNLGVALQYVEGQGALPWLVIDVQATATELAHLVEYLAGSPLSAYGKLRSRDGAIGRWTDSFNLIYIELVDRDDHLPNDASRANYVHWIMDQIKGAPDFPSIRNQVFFIDGMRYDDGRSHTTADFHAGDLRPDRPLDSLVAFEEILNNWRNAIPRRGMPGGLVIPEYIRSVRLDGHGEPPRLVDAVGALLADLGGHSAAALMDINLAEGVTRPESKLARQALQVTEGLAGLALLEEPVLVRGEKEAGELQGAGDNRHDPLLFFAFGSRDVTLVFALNLDRTAHPVSIQGLDRQSSHFELLDHRGTVISEGAWGKRRDSFTLLPGGVLVIRQER